MGQCTGGLRDIWHRVILVIMSVTRVQTSWGISFDSLYWSVWFRFPHIPLFLFFFLFLSISKCEVLIQRVINRKADKEKYKSLDLHFIFWYCTATSLTRCSNPLASVLMECKAVVVALKIWPFHAAAWYNLHLIALVFLLSYHGRMVKKRKKKNLLKQQLYCTT